MTTKIIEAPVKALTLPQRAAVALGTAEHEKQLLLLVAESKTIAEIKNKDARTQCHAAYMKLKNSRVAIDHAADYATEDAKQFTKAVKTEKDRLIALMSAEEDRLLSLRDQWDADREAEKQAKIEAERARVAKIQKMIGSLRDYPRMILASDPAVLSTTLQAAIDEFDGWTPHVDDYAEFVPEAAAAIAESLAAMRAMLTQAIAKEAAEAKAKADREAEAARLQAEREELARQRAEVAAKLAQQEREAAIERERIAKEQAAAEAELAAQRAEMARQQAERDAQAAAQAKVAREAQDAAQAKLDAERAELDRERAAMVEAKRKQEAEESERFRLQALADQMLADHAEALEMNAVYVAPVAEALPAKPAPAVMQLRPSSIPVHPSDDEIIEVLALHYNAHESDVIAWLLEMDLVSAGIRMIAHN